MLKAYLRRFERTDPFTEDALLTLARMSRGIFHRFLRYITFTLHLWERYPKPRGIIESATVKEAVTVECLAEDMELELAELFPNKSDLQLQAVRLLMRLEEAGPRKQSSLPRLRFMAYQRVTPLLWGGSHYPYATGRCRFACPQRRPLQWFDAE